jgi:hypothetical protein
MVKIILLLLINLPLFSQSVVSRNRQFEAGLNLGAIAYLGDVQGNKGVGTKFLKDLNLANTKTYQGAFFTYYPDFGDKGYGLRLSIGQGTIHAADSLIRDYGGDELSRKKRNLSFKTSIQEIALTAEYHLTLKSFRPFVTAGVGLLHFTPKTFYNGEWVKLAPLQTEGIKYPTMQAMFPVGFGFKYFTESQKVISFEVLYRYTGTDYLDDVSTVYPDNVSGVSRELSYRNSGYDAGDQRGDPSDNDDYFTVVLKYSILLKQDVKFLRKQSLKCPRYF